MSQLFNELSFIRWLGPFLAPKVSDADSSERPLIGDDCAVLPGKGGPDLLVTTDMLMEGSCFLLDRPDSYWRVGRKAMSVNLSDIAAMAGTPRYAFVSLGLPKTALEDDVQSLMKGISERASTFGVVIAGGDTNVWDGGLTVSLTLVGHCGPWGPVRRSGAKAGDGLFVTGSLGGSILGHHLNFMPRVAEAHGLCGIGPVSAMIDISDGFALDLHRLAAASSVGAEVWADRIPISPAALGMNDSKTPLRHALTDGEDFELLFAASRDVGDRLLKAAAAGTLGFPVTQIGKIVDAGMTLVENGVARPLLPEGYVHSS